MIKKHTCLRDFVFRGLLFESEAENFRGAGISVGNDLSRTEQTLLNEVLAPFNIDRRNKALEMARLYAITYCFENEVRSLISDTLEEKHGSDWWEKDVVPSRVKSKAEERKKVAETDSYFEGVNGDVLEFADFGDLSSIITENWDEFKGIVPNQEWVKQRMNELEKARNFIAHNRMLLPNEFQRMYMYISDWDKQVGF